MVHFLQMEWQEEADRTTESLALTNVCVTQLQALSEAGAYFNPLHLRPPLFSYCMKLIEISYLGNTGSIPAPVQLPTKLRQIAFVEGLLWSQK